jgi:hypothetical protein
MGGNKWVANNQNTQQTVKAHSGEESFSFLLEVWKTIDALLSKILGYLFV